MNCLNNLISSNFLRNTFSEIKKANAILHNAIPSAKTFGFLPGNIADRKKLYQKYLQLYGIKANFYDIDVEDVDMVYYLQEGDLVWVASRHEFVVDKVISESLYTTGDVCLYKAKHFIHNKLYHAAMFDLAFKITPLTVN